MKIGLIADIHAQVDSLEKAFEIFERERVDQILCAGDLVERGYDGDAVVRRIQERNIPCVRGNHDEDAIENQAWWRREMDPDNVQKILKRLEAGTDSLESYLLTDSTLDYLKQLPFSLRFTFESWNILLVHGSPKSNTQYLTPSLPERIIAESVEDLDGIDILICGHSHTPMKRLVQGILVLNPGSTCYAGNPRYSNTCAVLTLPTLRYEVFSLATGNQIVI